MLIDLVVSLIIVGVALYLIQLIPMDDTMRQIIRALVIVVVLLYVLSMLGGWHSGFGGHWIRR